MYSRRLGLCLSFAVALVVAVAVPQTGFADIVDADYMVEDDKDANADATVYLSGHFFDTWMEVVCEDPNSDDVVYVGAEATHPDKVTVSKNNGKVAQKKKDNEADIYIGGTSLNWGEDGEDNDSVAVVCEKSTVDSSIKDKDGNGQGASGKFKAKGSKCAKPLDAAQAGEVIGWCDTKSLKGKISDAGDIKSLQISGKGNAAYYDD